MVTTQFLRPALLLRPFVTCYALREFDTGDSTMPQLLHAIHQHYLTFFLKGKSCVVRDLSGKSERIYGDSLVGALVEPMGCAFYSGHYRLFSVQFKSNGVSAIFGIPQCWLLNSIISAEDLLTSDKRILVEQLGMAETPQAMSVHMDQYLIKMLLRQKQRLHTRTIARISNIIFHHKGMVSIDELAAAANMSFRNFERRFIEEIGISPKLHARITRFFNAVENKMLHPNKQWTAITYENGYFDQAHLIREVKLFSGQTPGDLFRHTPPPIEEFSGDILD